VVLLDIGLPDIDGYEVARRLRAAPGGSAMFLVALTGYGQSGDEAAAYAAGFDRHMTKPVEPPTLARLLTEIAPARASQSAE
jgi:CheY-like chemotaxis protein